MTTTLNAQCIMSATPLNVTITKEMLDKAQTMALILCHQCKAPWDNLKVSERGNRLDNTTTFTANNCDLSVEVTSTWQTIEVKMTYQALPSNHRRSEYNSYGTNNVIWESFTLPQDVENQAIRDNVRNVKEALFHAVRDIYPTI